MCSIPRTVDVSALASGTPAVPKRSVSRSRRHRPSPLESRNSVTRRMAQNSPHMEQAFVLVLLFLPDDSNLWGSMTSFFCPSQSSFFRALESLRSLSRAPGTPLTMSAAWAAILEAIEALPGRPRPKGGRGVPRA